MDQSLQRREEPGASPHGGLTREAVVLARKPPEQEFPRKCRPSMSTTAGESRNQPTFPGGANHGPSCPAKFISVPPPGPEVNPTGSTRQCYQRFDRLFQSIPYDHKNQHSPQTIGKILPRGLQHFRREVKLPRSAQPFPETRSGDVTGALRLKFAPGDHRKRRARGRPGLIFWCNMGWAAPHPPETSGRNLLPAKGFRGVDSP